MVADTAAVVDLVVVVMGMETEDIESDRTEVDMIQ